MAKVKAMVRIRKNCSVRVLHVPSEYVGYDEVWHPATSRLDNVSCHLRAYVHVNISEFM